jgi:hypothetical protein
MYIIQEEKADGNFKKIFALCSNINVSLLHVENRSGPMKTAANMNGDYGLGYSQQKSSFFTSLLPVPE